MARRKLWSNSVSRVELDHRARDARIRLFQIERLFLPRAPVAGFRLGPLIRLLGSRAGGNGRRGGRGSGSQSDSRLGCIRETAPAWCGCGAFSRVCEAATVGRGPVDEIRCLVLQEPGASLKTIWSYLQPDSPPLASLLSVSSASQSGHAAVLG